MSALTEADILGRRIDNLFVSAVIDLTAGNQILYRFGKVNWPAPSDKTVVAFVQLAILTGAPAATTTTYFGITNTGAEWSIAQQVTLAYAARPILFYPGTTASFLPGPFGTGTPFWVNFAGASPWANGSTGVFTIYGWSY